MLLDLLASKLQPARRATTAQEREAIYRLQYEVYVQELQRADYPGVDHARRMVTIDRADDPNTALIYAGSVDEMKGAVRIHTWPPGTAPAYIRRDYALHRFGGIEAVTIAEVGALAARRGARGANRLTFVSLMCTCYEVMVAELGVELAFFCAVPPLVRHYLQAVGARLYGGSMFDRQGVASVPMVALLSDVEHMRRIGSFLAPLAKKHFGRRKRPRLDPQQFAHVWDEDPAAAIDPRQIWAELEDSVLGTDEPPVLLLDGLSPKAVKRLIERGIVIDVAPGKELLHEQMTGDEMYVVLAGAFEISVGGRRIDTCGVGELVGEVAFLTETRHRTATVRALAPSRVLMLKHASLRALTLAEPEEGYRVMLNLARVLAGRFSERLQTVRRLQAQLDAVDADHEGLASDDA